MLKGKNISLYIVVGLCILVIILFSKFFTTKEVKLYFSDAQAQYLTAEIRKVKTNNLYDNVVKELIEGPESEELEMTIPTQTKLLGVEVKERIAIVNFSKEIQTKHWGGSTGETITVYSIVNTLTALDGIDKVQILVEGVKVQTLVGHLELDNPLTFNSNLIN
ncbi:sporulation and spore germination protein [Orenia metallireducens]|jgi:spore germination protein GerM|uniref:Sporulation and spore germination n=1 Tax=Orenia metallireducens TaxID=1413210 RepID=A0A285H5W7_9FIRM|nr:GerMN domain-containing protein [Orenia metallireducens]PRX17802.1 sporulation and spore germination protein [Orenia metallireducens]SNY31148.1 Sporulation and spore germination [Orenia metallireducens]